MTARTTPRIRAWCRECKAVTFHDVWLEAHIVGRCRRCRTWHGTAIEAAPGPIDYPPRTA